MNADGFRRLYEYHFTLNRRLWDESIAPPTAEQFRRPVGYSIGSIRNQVVHIQDYALYVTGRI